VVKRKDWETAQEAISSLTFNRLEAAARSVHETGTHNDPTIRLLERHIQSIASQVPQSFALMRAAVRELPRSLHAREKHAKKKHYCKR
jgi:hypothetical protein